MPQQFQQQQQQQQQQPPMQGYGQPIPQGIPVAAPVFGAGGYVNTANPNVDVSLETAERNAQNLAASQCCFCFPLITGFTVLMWLAVVFGTIGFISNIVNGQVGGAIGSLITVSAGAAGLYGKHNLKPQMVTYTIVIQWIGVFFTGLGAAALFILGIVLLASPTTGCDDKHSGDDDDEPNWCRIGKLVGLLFMFLAVMLACLCMLYVYFVRVVTKFREYLKIQVYIRSRERIPGQVVVGQPVVSVAGYPQQPYPGYGYPQPQPGQFYPQAAVGQPMPQQPFYPNAGGPAAGGQPQVVSGFAVVEDSGASPNPPKA